MTIFNYKILPNYISTGIEYPVKSIKVRGLTIKELRAIATANIKQWTMSNILEYFGKGDVIILEKEDGTKEDLGKLAKEDGTKEDLGKLAKEDFFVLLFFVNILTNPDYKLTYSSHCPKCEEKNLFDVTIDKIKFNIKKLPKQIPLNISLGIKCNIRRLNVSDLVLSDEVSEKFKEKGYEEADILKALMCDFEINEEIEKMFEENETDLSNFTDEEKDILKKLFILDMFNMKDLQELLKIISMFKIDMKPFEVTCSNCKTNYKTEIELDLKDVLPTDVLNLYLEFRYNF